MCPPPQYSLLSLSFSLICCCAKAPAELSGYLQKLGDKGLTKRWSQRWFQQKGRHIYYYKERPKPTGTSRGNTDIVEIHSVRTPQSRPNATVKFFHIPIR